MTADDRKYLIFTLQNRWFAFDLANIAEVNEVPPVMYPIPSAPACYPGAINLHGVVVAVMDLAAFCGLTNCRIPEKMIALAGHIASLAFLVEQVIRITAFGEGRLDEAPKEDFAVATLVLPDGVATLLDAHLIVTHAQETING